MTNYKELISGNSIGEVEITEKFSFWYHFFLLSLKFIFIKSIVIVLGLCLQPLIFYSYHLSIIVLEKNHIVLVLFSIRLNSYCLI